MDHYESNGWRVGRNPMKDWRAAVRTWETNGLAAPAPQPAKPRGRDPFFEKVDQWKREKEAEEAAREPLGDENAARAVPDIGPREHVAQDAEGSDP